MTNNHTWIIHHADVCRYSYKTWGLYGIKEQEFLQDKSKQGFNHMDPAWSNHMDPISQQKQGWFAPTNSMSVITIGETLIELPLHLPGFSSCMWVGCWQQPCLFGNMTVTDMVFHCDFLLTINPFSMGCDGPHIYIYVHIIIYSIFIVQVTPQN